MPRRQAIQAKVGVRQTDGPAVMFHKTKFCKFYQEGKCLRGKSCLFAHADQELAPLPDFSCTSLCPVLLKTGSCNKSGCKFAHSEMELRDWQGRTENADRNMVGSSRNTGAAQYNKDEFRMLQGIIQQLMTQVDSLQARITHVSQSPVDDDDDINTSCCMPSMGQDAWSRMSTEDVSESNGNFSRQSTGVSSWASEEFDQEDDLSLQQGHDNLGNRTMAAFNVCVKNTFLGVNEPAQVLRRVSSAPAMF